MDEDTLDGSSSSLDAPASLLDPVLDSQQSPPSGSGPRHSLHKRYIIFGLIGLAAVVLMILVSALLTKKDQKKQPVLRPITINTQSLDNGTLNKLTATPGPASNKTQLTIAPDTLFKSDVHVQGAQQVDKNLEVAGTSTLQGAVSITSNLAVRGSLSVGGSLSASSLNIGTLTTTAITASGSISFGEHLIPTGAEPAVTAGRSALGGSVQISGNDTAGTVTISTGSGSTLAGELATIHFHKAFSATPKVQLTPVNPESAALRFYAARTAGFMTIDTATPPVPQTSYIFDYLVTQ